MASPFKTSSPSLSDGRDARLARKVPNATGSSAAGMQPARPAVSIILPYYEGTRWLRGSVESVRRQTERNWELLVVDDGSKSPAAAVIDDITDPRIRLVRIPHCGKGGALNRGVLESTGDYVCFIDQDDRMLPQRLEIQLACLGCESQADGVYSDYERRHADGRLIDRAYRRQVSPEEALHLLATGRSPMTMQTLMLTKACFGRLGGFSEDPRLTGLDDLEFFVRLLISGPVLVHAPGVVQTWVLHDRNYSNRPQFQEARLHCLQRLEELGRRHPVLQKHLKRFRYHAHTQRGVYFLETGKPARAVPALIKALHADPLSPNTHYLLLKALVLSAC
jgi:glycosyltransferase involved in cell wall biosynthesis